MRRVSAFQQQQQLSIEILTKPIDQTSTNTMYYRKSAVLKQKARSRSGYILLSSKLFIQTIASGIPGTVYQVGI